MNERIARLMKLAIEYDRGDRRRIHHLLKVHDLTVTIGRLEGVDEATMTTAEAAAIVAQGPGEARLLMRRTGGFTTAETDRVAYLREHCHDYMSVEGMDRQILLEAEMLVDIHECQLTQEAIENIGRELFKTKTGRQLLDAMYGGKPWTAAPEGDLCTSCC